MQPYTFDQARTAAASASRSQEEAEKFMRESARNAAVAEESYRIALAKAMVQLHNDGAAWTTCADLARGDEKVARLRRERDIAEGVREAALQATWRRAADRKDTSRFIDWSMRRELADPGTDPPALEAAA